MQELTEKGGHDIYCLSQEKITYNLKKNLRRTLQFRLREMM